MEVHVRGEMSAALLLALLYLQIKQRSQVGHAIQWQLAQATSVVIRGPTRESRYQIDEHLLG